jgi:hypothetical protein
MGEPLESLIQFRAEPDGRLSIHPAEIERRYCPNDGAAMTPGVPANDPPARYWVCPLCHQAERE